MRKAGPICAGRGRPVGRSRTGAYGRTYRAYRGGGGGGLPGDKCNGSNFAGGGGGFATSKIPQASNTLLLLGGLGRSLLFPSELCMAPTVSWDRCKWGAGVGQTWGGHMGTRRGTRSSVLLRPTLLCDLVVGHHEAGAAHKSQSQLARGPRGSEKLHAPTGSPLHRVFVLQKRHPVLFGKRQFFDTTPGPPLQIVPENGLSGNWCSVPHPIRRPQGTTTNHMPAC